MEILTETSENAELVRAWHKAAHGRAELLLAAGLATSP
jgi:hypothetical protein